MFQGPLEDRYAIRELIDTYTDAVIRRDENAWANTWTENAVWDLGRGPVTGRANILETWKGAMAGFSFVAFLASPGMISVEGTRAQARVHTQEFLVLQNGDVMRIVGLYTDRLEKHDARWRFSSRNYQILHQS